MENWAKGKYWKTVRLKRKERRKEPKGREKKKSVRKKARKERKTDKLDVVKSSNIVVADIQK